MSSVTHGLAKHPLYKTWRNIKQRCYNPRNHGYKNYGGRGIKLCPEWHNPQTFIEDIERLLGPRPPDMTLDRINNDGDYEPGNVRWATAQQQAPRGERNGNAKLTEVQVLEIRRLYATGEYTFQEIAEMFNVGALTISDIVNRKTWTHLT